MIAGTGPSTTVRSAPDAVLATGPTGLGTSAARSLLAWADRSAPAPHPGTAAPAPPPPAAERGTRFPGLQCPDPVRVDEALGDEVNDRLTKWAEEVGIYVDRLEYFRACRFGHLLMLTHPDTHDPDKLLLAAQWMVALFAVDDHYVDDERYGAIPEKTAPRLSLAAAAMDPAYLVGSYATRLQDALQAEPVLVALTDSLDRISPYATPSQMARMRHEAKAMYLAMNAEVAWRYTGRSPSTWEFLAARQVNSFLPGTMTMIDVLGGYELPDNLYSDPRVRRAVKLAASATVVVNDLYSASRASAPGNGDFNLPALTAVEQGCSLDEALEISVSVHNEFVRALTTVHQSLLSVPSPQLQRFLLGLWTWLGGNREWHDTSPRYAT